MKATLSRRGADAPLQAGTQCSVEEERASYAFPSIHRQVGPRAPRGAPPGGCRGSRDRRMRLELEQLHGLERVVRLRLERQGRLDSQDVLEPVLRSDGEAGQGR